MQFDPPKQEINLVKKVEHSCAISVVTDTKLEGNLNQISKIASCFNVNST